MSSSAPFLSSTLSKRRWLPLVLFAIDMTVQVLTLIICAAMCKYHDYFSYL
jgi:hypothetical protein